MAISPQSIEAKRPRKVFYPERDGKPMGETLEHVRLIAYAVKASGARFHDEPEVYVAGNNFVYCEEGNNRARLCPDTYVVFGESGKDQST